MEWNKGYSATYYVMEVDPNTWKDISRFEITGGSITRGLDNLRQSATLDCVDYDQSRERWVRVYLDTIQSGTGAHVPLFTGLAVSPERDIRGSWTQNSVSCYSVLKPAEDILLSRGWYAPADMDCRTTLMQLLDTVPAPVQFPDEEMKLLDHIVAEAGETALSMIEQILAAINWNMKINGDGTIVFEPYTNESKQILDPLSFDVIETEIRVTANWFDCPNVFMASNEYTSAIVKDEDPDSPLSIQNRGREVWMQETDCQLAVGETIQSYAERRLAEEQEYVVSASYDRRFIPELMPSDTITLHYPAQGLQGDYTIISQNIDLGFAAKTSEEIVGVM